MNTLHLKISLLIIYDFCYCINLKVLKKEHFMKNLVLKFQDLSIR